MVLPMPLEMLGCPAWLFLDQWQRVNGCRCVAKEGSEIPTDPGRSESSTCRLVCVCVCVSRPSLQISFPVPSLYSHPPFLSSCVRLPTCLSFLAIHHHLILRPYLLLNFHNSLTPLCRCCSHPWATSWTGFWKLNAKFIRAAFEHIHSLGSFHSAHAVALKRLVKGDKCKIITATLKDFIYFDTRLLLDLHLSVTVVFFSCSLPLSPICAPPYVAAL